MKPKTLLKAFSLDIGFFLAVFLIFELVRGEIRSYLGLLGEYKAGLMGITAESDLLGVQKSLSNIAGVTNKALLLMIIAVVLVFLAYAVFEGLSFYVLQKRGDKRYLLWFSLASLPGYLMLIFMFDYLFTGFWSSLFLIICFLLLAFLGFACYFKQDFKGWAKLIKDYAFWLWFLGYCLLFLTAFASAMAFYIGAMIGEYNYFILMIAAALIFGFSGYKYWIVGKIN